jgi:hypothetical protein
LGNLNLFRLSTRLLRLTVSDGGQVFGFRIFSPECPPGY